MKPIAHEKLDQAVRLLFDFGLDYWLRHALPGPIQDAAGQVVHLDFGVKWQGYCADLQRCWCLARPGEVYTLELGVMSPAGIVSLEEMVVVITETGCRFLSEPQCTVPVVRLP